jgi:alpha-acetolactate decarboxylase
MKSRFVVLFAVIGASLGLVACGGSDNATTVTEASPSAETSAESSASDERIKRIEEETKEAELEAALAKKEAAQQAAKAKRAAAKQAAASRAEATQAAEQEEESASEPPDVIGMRLPEAESALRAAGFRIQAENTDTTFGIVIRSRYTICTESEPHGGVVTVLAQKYGC